MSDSCTRDRETTEKTQSCHPDSALLLRLLGWLGNLIRSLVRILALGGKLDRRRVDTKSHPRGGRPVVEDVAEVAAATLAGDLGANHPQAGIGVLLDGPRGDDLVEAGPAAVGVELVVALEEDGAARRTLIDAGRLGVVVLSGEGTLGALGAEDAVLLRR